MKTYRALLNALYSTPHCILPEKLREIEAFLHIKSSGGDTSDVVVEQPQLACYSATGDLVAQDRLETANAGSSFLAVLPLFGTMYQHGGIEMQASGGTSTEQFGTQFDALDRNPAVKTIVIETHSPGGQVFGTQELSDKIHNAETRTVALGNSLVASAAVWASTAADLVCITPGGQMGSIGVVTVHEDVTAAEEKIGVKTTLIATPEKKTEEFGYTPLTEEIEQTMRERTEAIYDRFVGAVARNMGVSAGKVMSDFGGGGMLSADDAVAAGLANTVATRDEVLAWEIDLLHTAANSGNRQHNANRIALAEAEGIKYI